MYKRRMPTFLAPLQPIRFCTTSKANPPGVYYWKVSPQHRGNADFRLVPGGRSAYSILILNSSDQVLSTAAQDVARYFGEM